MNTFLRSLFTVTHVFSTSVMRQRARGILATIWIINGLWLLYITTVGLAVALSDASFTTLTNFGTLFFPVLALIGLWLLQRGYIQQAAFFTVSSMALPALQGMFGGPNDLYVLGVSVPLVAGGVLLTRRQFIGFALAIAVALVVRGFWLGGFTRPVSTVPADAAVTSVLVAVASFGTVVGFLYVFNDSAERSAKEVVDEARFLRAAARLNTSADQIIDLESVLDNVLLSFQDVFGFFNTQIYLIADDGQMTRYTRTVIAGQGVISQSPSTEVSRLVRFTMAERQPVALDRTASSDRRDLITLPARRVIGLPMLTGNKLIGIIEAQSDDLRPFTQIEIETLGLYALQAASLISIINQITTLRVGIDEAQENVTRLSRQLRSREMTNIETSREEWENYLRRRGQVLGYDQVASGQPTFVALADMPPALQETMTLGQFNIVTLADAQQLTVPIIVRGSLLGGIALTLPLNRVITQYQIELVRNVTDRLASALENTRLFEQSQNLAKRERLANDAAQRLFGIFDVQMLLDVAADEFQKVLGAVYTRVHLDTDALEETGAPQEAS